MPEVREIIAFYLILRHLLGKHFGWSPNTRIAWAVAAIWTDPAVSETHGITARAPQAVQHRMHAKVPFRVTAEFPTLRGRGSARSPLWPPDVVDLTTLTLGGIDIRPRGLVLDFGSRWLSFHFGTHTSIQVYSANEWKLLQGMPQEGRTFKFAFVLEFKRAAIAFLSLDLLFQAKWSSAEPERPHTCYPYESYAMLELRSPADGSHPLRPFLHIAASWLRTHLEARGTPRGTAWEMRLAMDVFRELGGDKGIVAGYGVYSTSEAWHWAGLSHTLTARELFFCPSRFARLLESCIAFPEEAWDTLLDQHLKPALQGSHLLAPTEAQRVNCAKRMFRVWAKDKIYVSQRVSDIRNECAYDVFEPTYFANALRRYNNLGRLIFGRFWAPGSDCIYSPSIPITVPAEDDPLTALYREYDMLDAETFLDEDAYASPSPLFLSTQDMRAKLVDVFCYKQSSKCVWSIVRPEYNTGAVLIEGAERTQRLSETIIRTTETVSVGPLEFCGNALAFRKAGRPKQRVHVALCKGDPGVRLGNVDYYVRRLVRLNRAKGNSVIAGKRKKALRELVERKARSTELPGRKKLVSGAATLKRKLDAHRRMTQYANATNLIFSQAAVAVSSTASMNMPTSQQPTQRRRNADQRLSEENVGRTRGSRLRVTVARVRSGAV